MCIPSTRLQRLICSAFTCYDVLLDEGLRPWLLEVNASPSLTSSTRADALLKQALVDDVLRLVAPAGKALASPNAYSEADLGDFEQILPGAQTPPYRAHASPSHTDTAPPPRYHVTSPELQLPPPPPCPAG
ncbi:hypothetical protein HPB49_005634 [Dermacentor silvarum]|uniref:Uncharacterized protein n=1 Tax=Dermacentor silvarum TaxID=543639 RepID=A0ACB8CJP8_DERSI|nr:hypothetical protein HPB49_005634 [Dermacentor silvarum]